MPVGAFVALMGVAVLWGSAFPMIKIGLEDLSVPHLTVTRHLVASSAFLLFLVATRSRLLPERKDVGYFLLLGFLGIFVYHTGLNLGELRVSAGATSLIIASAPAVTALLAHGMLGQRMPALGWIGSFTSFAGVALIVLGDAAGFQFDPFAGFIVVAAVTTSFYFVLQQRLFDRYRPLEVTAFVTWGGTVPMVVYLPGLPAALASTPSEALLAAVYIGVFPSAIAYSLFTFAQTRAPISVVATMMYSVPVFSLTMSWLLLGEVPSPLTLFGGTVAIVGIAVVQHARRQATRRAAIPLGTHEAS